MPVAPLHLTCDIQVVSPHAAYGTMVSPPYNIHDDFDANFDDKTTLKTNVYIDRNARVMMAQPTPLIQDTTLADWTALSPGGTAWHDEIVDPASGYLGLLMDDASDAVDFDIVSTGYPGLQGHYVKIGRGLPPAATTKDGDNVFFEYWICNG